jgi:hypothetical protein
MRAHRSTSSWYESSVTRRQVYHWTCASCGLQPTECSARALLGAVVCSKRPLRGLRCENNSPMQIRRPLASQPSMGIPCTYSCDLCWLFHAYNAAGRFSKTPLLAAMSVCCGGWIACGVLLWFGHPVHITLCTRRALQSCTDLVTKS